MIRTDDAVHFLRHWEAFHRRGIENAEFFGISQGMDQVNFWLSQRQDAHRVLMNQAELQSLSQRLCIIRGTGRVDLRAYPAVLSRAELAALLSERALCREVRYRGAERVTSSYWDSLLAAQNEGALADDNRVKYGFAVRETAVRRLPTPDVSYIKPDDVDFDLFQETTLKVWEPVVLLHHSADRAWYFAQSSSYLGWVAAADIGVAESDVWQHWLTVIERDFLMVVGANWVLEVGGRAALKISMGTRLPLAEPQETGAFYKVLLPACGMDGRLKVATRMISGSAPVVMGYLPYSQATILRQAFKLLGEPYGWGGLRQTHDCSSLIRDCYLTVGLELPRDGRGQALTPAVRLPVSGLEDGNKEALIGGQSVGTILFFPGHVMLLLGYVGNKAYVIHDVYACGASGDGGTGRCRPVKSIIVSNLYITRADGSSFLSNISALVSIVRPPIGEQIKSALRF